MKNVKLFLFLYGIIVIIISGCENNDGCNEQPQQVVILHFGDTTGNTQYRLQNIDTEQETVNLVINSQTDYEKYVAGNGTLPVIDFNHYTFLAGRMKTSASGMVTDQYVTRKCYEYTYTVNIEEGNLGVVSAVYYFAVIEKANGKVIFDIHYVNTGSV